MQELQKQALQLDKALSTGTKLSADTNEFSNKISKVVADAKKSFEDLSNNTKITPELSDEAINKSLKAISENIKSIANTDGLNALGKDLKEAFDSGDSAKVVGNIQEIAKASDEAKSSLEKYISDSKKSLALLRSQGSEGTEAYSAIEKGIESATKELSQFQTEIAETGKEGSKLGGIFSSDGFVGGLAGGAAAAGIGLITSAISNGIGSVQEFTQEIQSLRTNLANTTNLGSEDIDKIASRITATASTFGEESGEIIKSAQKLAAQTGEPIEQVLTNIQQGFAGSAGASGELLAVTQEYGNVINEVGGSSADLINILGKSTEAGVFSDKGVDVIKEFGLRIRELPQGTKDALDAIGVSSVQVQKDLESGNKTVLNVLADVTGALDKLPETSSEVGAAIADIFGGPGEDAGLKFLTSLSDIDSQLGTVQGSTNEFAKAQLRSLQATEQLSSIATNLFGDLATSSGALTTDIKILFAEFLRIIDIVGFIEDVKTAFSGLSSEAGDLGKAIGAIIGGTVLTAFKVLQGAIVFVIDLIVEIANALGDAFSPITKLFDTAGESAVDLADVFDGLGTVIGDIFDIVLELAGVFIDLGAGAIKLVVEAVVQLIGFFTDLFSTTAETSDVTEEAGSAFDTFRNALLSIKGVVSGVRASLDVVVETIRTFIKNLRSFNISEALDAFTGFGGKVQEAFQEGFDEGSFDLSKAEDVFDDFSNKLNDATDTGSVGLLINEIQKLTDVTDEQKAKLIETGEARILTLNAENKAIKENAEIDKNANLEKVRSASKANAEQAELLKKQKEEQKKTFDEIKAFIVASTNERNAEVLALQEKANQQILSDNQETIASLQNQLNSLSFQPIENDIFGLSQAINEAPNQLNELQSISDQIIAILDNNASKQIEILNTRKQREIETLTKEFEEKKALVKDNSDLQEQLALELNNRIASINAIYNEQEIELLNQANAQKLDVISEQNQKETDIQKAVADAKTEIKNLEIAQDEERLGQLSGILQQSQSLLKEDALAYKGLAVAEATISTYLAATKALALGFPIGPIQAGLTIIQGLANVAQILGVGFKTGGYTGNKGINDAVGIVHGQEFVHTADVTKRERPLFEYLQKGGTSEDYYNMMFANPVAKPNLIIEQELSNKDIIKAVEGLGDRIQNQKITQSFNIEVDNKSSNAIKIKRRALARL